MFSRIDCKQLTRHELAWTIDICIPFNYDKRSLIQISFNCIWCLLFVRTVIKCRAYDWLVSRGKYINRIILIININISQLESFLSVQYRNIVEACKGFNPFKMSHVSFILFFLIAFYFLHILLFICCTGSAYNEDALGKLFS